MDFAGAWVVPDLTEPFDEIKARFEK